MYYFYYQVICTIFWKWLLYLIVQTFDYVQPIITEYSQIVPDCVW